VRRYRTQIVVPPDRTVVLHLPEHFAEGPARLVIEIAEPDDEADPGLDERLDQEDIEWWEEFEGDPSGPATEGPA
jgi:hypothetical protein